MVNIEGSYLIDPDIIVIDSCGIWTFLLMVMGCDEIPFLIHAIGSWDLHLKKTILRGSCGLLDDLGRQFNNDNVVPAFNSVRACQYILYL